MIRVVHPGSRIRMLTFSHPGSRGQKGTQSRIPDPDPQHWSLHGSIVSRHCFVVSLHRSRFSFWCKSGSGFSFWCGSRTNLSFDADAASKNEADTCIRYSTNPDLHNCWNVQIFLLEKVNHRYQSMYLYLGAQPVKDIYTSPSLNKTSLKRAQAWPSRGWVFLLKADTYG